jgi:hypothetical protein
MTSQIKLFDEVALIAEKADRGLSRGQVGTVVELHGSDFYEIEFADRSGRTIAFAALPASDLIVLQCEFAHGAGSPPA